MRQSFLSTTGTGGSVSVEELEMEGCYDCNTPPM